VFFFSSFSEKKNRQAANSPGKKKTLLPTMPTSKQTIVIFYKFKFSKRKFQITKHCEEKILNLQKYSKISK